MKKEFQTKMYSGEIKDRKMYLLWCVYVVPLVVIFRPTQLKYFLCRQILQTAINVPKATMLNCVMSNTTVKYHTSF